MRFVCKPRGRCDAGKQVIGFQIAARNTTFNNFRWQRGPGRIFIPLTTGNDGFKIVANNLLIKANLFTTGFPVVRRPKARTVWRKNFVDQYRFTGTANLTKLELGVRENNAALASVVSSRTVEAQRFLS